MGSPGVFQKTPAYTMASTPEHIALILIKQAQEGLQEDERSALEEWMALSDTNRAIAAEFMGTGQLQQRLLDVLSKRAIWDRIQEVIPHEAPAVQRKISWRWVAAAAMAGAIAVGGYIYQQNNMPVKQPAVAVMQDVLPGSNKATLTLANGSVVTLDSTGNQVIQQGNIAIQQRGGQLVYGPGNSGNTVSFNTLTTPRGGQFRLTLPDGSKVWLNAASSIRYPTAFTGRERKVTVTGEAYFEVAKRADAPFRVTVQNGMDIDVLGTSFNINAYTNEPGVNTTLLEGAVKVRDVILQPGQQARATAGQIKVINDVDTEQITAWKNGLFNFEGASLEEVMHQLERWYDIEVVYEKNIPHMVFGGEMGRDLTLQNVIGTLEGAGVHFRLEGRKLIVLP